MYDLKKHLKSKHDHRNEKEDLLRKQNDLSTKLSNQRAKLHESLYKFKQTEIQSKARCSCRGVCVINHYKYRWTQSKADILLNEVKETIQSTESSNKNECLSCGKAFLCEESLKRHTSLVHKSIIQIQCDQCDERFEENEDLQCHINLVHLPDSECSGMMKCCAQGFAKVKKMAAMFVGLVW